MTNFDFLWHHIPYVSLRGVNQQAQMGAIILEHCGLENLIAETEAAYVEKTVALVKNTGKLRGLQAQVGTAFAKSAFLKPDRIARGWEHRIRAVWRQRCGMQQEASDHDT